MRILQPSNDWCHRQRKYNTLIEVKLPCFGFNPCSVLNIQARNEGSAIFRYLCHQLTFAKVLTSIRKCFHIATATWIPNFPNYFKDLLLRQQRRNISFIMSLIMRFYKNVENTATSVNRMTSYLSSYLEWVTLQDFKNIAYVGRFRYFVCAFVFVFSYVFETLSSLAFRICLVRGVCEASEQC